MSVTHSEDNGVTADRWMEIGRLAELGLLSATMVHELKQPLFAIKSLLQVNPPDPDDQKAVQLHRILMEQVMQIEGILRAAGGLVQRPGDWEQPFAVHGPVQGACEALAVRARKQGVQLDCSLVPGLPVIRGNPVAMQQVLTNLLANALDAVSEVKEPMLSLVAEPGDDGVVMVISDNGPGIALEQQQRIFEPFFTTKPPGCGTGLGLSIARKLVEMAHGHIEVRSDDGLTEIRVFYPLDCRIR